MEAQITSKRENTGSSSDFLGEKTTCNQIIIIKFGVGTFSLSGNSTNHNTTVLIHTHLHALSGPCVMFPMTLFHSIVLRQGAWEFCVAIWRAHTMLHRLLHSDRCVSGSCLHISAFSCHFWVNSFNLLTRVYKALCNAFTLQLPCLMLACHQEYLAQGRLDMWKSFDCTTNLVPDGQLSLQNKPQPLRLRILPFHEKAMCIIKWLLVSTLLQHL